MPTVPCHNDLLAENYLDDGERLWLVDWEYSGNNDPAFELGNTAQELGYGPAQVEGCAPRTSAYPALLGRMHLQMIMSDVGWTLWAAIQARISTIDYDFTGWAEERWARAAAAWTDPIRGLAARRVSGRVNLGSRVSNLACRMPSTRWFESSETIWRQDAVRNHRRVPCARYIDAGLGFEDASKPAEGVERSSADVTTRTGRVFEPPRIAHFATIGPGGVPWVRPIWYVWEDGALFFTTRLRARRTGADIAAGSASAVSIASEGHPYQAVLARGVAEVWTVDQDAWFERFARRYGVYPGWYNDAILGRGSRHLATSS